MLPQGSTALGQRGKDQDLGGFPGPIQLSQKFTRYYFPRFYNFVGRIFSEQQRDWKNDKTFNRLGIKFQKLTIYRNSDFNTEELDDDELEQLGGIEYVNIHMLEQFLYSSLSPFRYRALDFLNWLVITVSGDNFGETEHPVNFYYSTLSEYN
jgi:hypothetical protein